MLHATYGQSRLQTVAVVLVVPVPESQIYDKLEFGMRGLRGTRG